MKGLNKKWIVLMSVILGVGVGLYSLKHRWKEPALPYKAPNLVPRKEEAIEGSKYDEYEEILENKQVKPKAKKSLVRFGLAKLFTPRAAAKQLASLASNKSSSTSSKQPSKEPIKKQAVPTYFFAYQGEEKKATTVTTGERPHFFKARVYKEQKVKDRGAVVVKLQDKIVLVDKILPAGTLLYGEAKFAKDRMHVTFRVAKWAEAHIPVHLEGYDQDLLLGFSGPGLAPSLTQKAEDKALQKAMEHTESGLLEDLGKGAVETWREVTRKKEAFLEDRKGVYVRVVEKKQR
jgi:hypothetical protein